jgi:hypothetical protein
MGQCVSCIPASLQVAPEVYTGGDTLPKDIIQVTPTSDQALLDEFIDVIANSFCGSTESSPEAAISWTFDPTSSGENPTDFLTSEPSAARIKFFKFIGGFVAHSGFRHGGCFALKGPDGNLVAATVTFPPNNKHLHQTSFCEMMDIVKKMGGWAEVGTPEIQGGDSEKRMRKLEQLMDKSHKAHAPGLHLYVLAFATAIGQHGRGYGRKLMTFLVESAGRMNVPVYLECSGKKNERFYGANGFKMMQRYPIQFNNHSFNPDELEGITAMVRQNN